MSSAHAVGLRLVPYTLDTREQIATAVTAGVDELITNDPLLARRTEAELDTKPPPIPPPPSASACRAARAHQQPRHDRGVRLAAQGAARVRDAVQAGGAPRRHVLELPHQDRVHDPRATCCRGWPRGAPNVVAFNEDVGPDDARHRVARGRRRARSSRTRDVGCPGAAVPVRDPRRRCSRSGRAYCDAAHRLPPALRRPCRSSAACSSAAPTPSRAAGCRCSRTWRGATTSTSSARTTSRRSASRSTRPRSSASAIPTCRVPDVGLRRHRARGLQRGLHVGPGRRALRGPAPAAQRRGPEQEGAAHAIEEAIQVTPGPSTGPDAVENLRPYRVPGTRARIAFATSLPAFVYGDPPAGVDPCSDTRIYYMRCLDKLGANLVMQDEANPGPWATDPPVWQPLDWMRSTWRAAADPDRGLRLQRDSAPGGQPGRPGVRRSDGDHPARPAWLERAAPTSAIRASCGARRRTTQPRYEPYAGKKKRVPGAGAVGGAGRAPLGAARAGRPGWRPALAIAARTTTSRPRSWRTCRSRRILGVGTASRRPAEAGRGRTTSDAARPADARPWPGKRTELGSCGR